MRASSLLVVVAFAGCAVGRAKTVEKVTTGTFCVQNVPRETQGRRFDPAVDGRASLEAGVPPLQLHTAAAIGALEPLERLATLARARAPAAERAQPRAEVMEAILQASLDLSSALALVDCEAERARVTAKALEAAEDRQTKVIAISGLGLGGVASALAGLLSLVLVSDVPSTVIGVGGGVGEGALSAAALASRHETGFTHPINPLAEVWSGGAHPSIPEAVWIHLTTPEETPEGPRTARDWLRHAWTSTERLGDDPERDALLLGPGGLYRPLPLGMRAVMLTELRTVMALFAQDLQRLGAEVARLARP